MLIYFGDNVLRNYILKYYEIRGYNQIFIYDNIFIKKPTQESMSNYIVIDYKDIDDLEFKNNNYLRSYYNGQIKSNKNQWEGWLKRSWTNSFKNKIWLVDFYHALEKNDFSKYKVGAMILDLNDPTKVIARANRPVLEPDSDYENNGYKPGIVYVSGAVVKDGNLLVYYGGSDSYVCVAYADFEEFLDKLIKEETPQLKKKETLKNRNDSKKI